MIIACVSFIIFLFATYLFSKDDFMLLRKNITTEHVFNVIFLGLIPTLFVSRLAFVLSHISKVYLNPLVFFIVPYFPGMSLPGGIIGAWLFVFWYTRAKKLPSLRLLDILSLSFLYGLVCGLGIVAVYDVFARSKLWIRESILGIIVLCIAIVMTRIFLKGKWKEGVVSSITLLVSLLVMLLWYGLLYALTKHMPVIGEGIVLGAFALFSISMFGIAKLRKSL